MPLTPGSFSGVPSSPLEGKAAFNNFPYQYVVVERITSEYLLSQLLKTLVLAYNTLPEAQKAAAIQAAYKAALAEMK